MSRWLYRWASWSIDRPRLAILLVALLTVAAAPGLLRLELRTDGHALVPPNDPAVVFDEQVRRDFLLRDPIVVLVESPHPNGVYNPGTLRRLRGLTEALARLDGIGKDNVVSLATERRDRVYPGTLVFRTLLDPLPDTPVLLDLLRSDVDAIQIVKGTVISADGRAAAIHVGAPPSQDRKIYDRTALYRDVLAVTRPFARDGDRISVVGAPVAESLLGTHVQEDLLLLLPLSVALIATIIGLGCRRLWGIALGLAEVGGCLIWTFGIMGWLGVPVYLTTSLLPVILATVGVADDIHLLWRYQRVLARNPDEVHPEAVRMTMREMVRPIALTSVTTLIGFLSFNSSRIEPVSQFGTFAGVGIAYCIFYSLTVLPAALALLPADRMRHPRLTGRSEPGPVVRTIHALVLRPRLTLAALLAVSVAVGAGAWRLRVQDGWIDGFAPGSDFRQATERANHQLYGTHILLAHLRFDWPESRMPKVDDLQGPLLDGHALAAVGRFEDFLREQPGVGGVLGPYTQLATVNYLWHARKEGTRTVPLDEPETIDRLLRHYKRVRGEARLREVIHEDLKRTIVTIFLKDANYQDTRALMETTRAYARQHLEPMGVRLDFAGDVAVSQAMIPAIVRTQVVSLLLALVGSFLAVCILYRSLRIGLLALLPPSLAALWMFGVMGWLQIPLGVATSMFFAITLGIGIDYSIHFLERVDGAPPGEDPALWALREAGPAITADAFAIALGFGLFLLSQVPANARLGGLVCVALLASWLLTLAGLGSLLSRRRAPEFRRETVAA
ncbi:MAG TPA: MMPL family transporter [Thermoanaerobaculia bacterium]|jgi:hypothetical protein|nr:MMPL family transporter [Thermoanaerobaculia bacterium]